MPGAEASSRKHRVSIGSFQREGDTGSDYEKPRRENRYRHSSTKMPDVDGSKAEDQSRGTETNRVGDDRGQHLCRAVVGLGGSVDYCLDQPSQTDVPERRRKEVGFAKVRLKKGDIQVRLEPATLRSLDSPTEKVGKRVTSAWKASPGGLFPYPKAGKRRKLKEMVLV